MEFYAGAPDKVHGATIPYLDGYTVYTLREPHGVTGHIIPWNYPMQIIGRSVGAALAMGNACVLKPAEEACLTALAFAQIALRGRAAGRGAQRRAGARRRGRGGAGRRIRASSTSRSPARSGWGKLIQTAAAENVVPVTLELGGKSPQLVFEDADLDAALPFLVNAGIQNAGQTCSAASRILVHHSRYDELVSAMAGKYRDAGRRPRDRRSGPWPAGLHAAEGNRRRVHRSRRRSGGRRTRHHRRRCARRRRLCGADAVCRGEARSRAGPAGNLRPGAGGHPVRRTRTRRSRSPTAPPTGWSPRSGPGTAPARCVWRASCGPVRCS